VHPSHIPAAINTRQDQIQPPTPVVINGKEVTHTAFTTKIFQQEAVYLNEKENTEEGSTFATADGDVIHLPTGQHLLVDIKHVDYNFLNSQDRLAQAMVDLINESNESKLTLLSYHCHSLVPMGVSCIGVLLESHVAFHTWPEEGIIAMDLFTCDTEPLIPVLSVIKKLFAIPSQDMEEENDDGPPAPAMLWSHRLRGFRKGFSPNYNPYENPLEQDLSLCLLMKHYFDMKVSLVSEETEYQHVDIYKLINPQVSSLASYERSLSDVDSYEYLHPDSYRPDKVLFLDGVQQSSLYGEAAYHEALVHPAMLVHPNPKRVAIIGGGEGATLREVLKHKTVEEVTMVEIDQELVELCEEHLSEWSDCTDIVGSDADSCFDDSRASVVFEDAFSWFIDRFGKDETKEEMFDVIIMDALDPDKFVAIVGSLYKDNHFVESLFNGLSEEGVFVVQLGESNTIDDPSAEMGPDRDKANMMEALKNAGFESMHIYDEGHSHFSAPWSYLVCFKDSKSRASWYKTAAEIDIELHKRMDRTKSGKPALLYFDAPTMIRYQMPSKADEAIHCRRENKPWECEDYRGIDPEVVNIPASDLEARKSTVGEFAGRGLFAAHDIPYDSSLVMNIGVKAFHILPSTWSVIEDLHGWADENDGNFASVKDELSSVSTFTTGYGCMATLLGKNHFTVDAWITTFCNHGCNGTYNYGDDGDEFTEMNVDLDHASDDVLNTAHVWSPVIERHLRQVLGVGDATTRDIKKGEEILCNYLSFIGDPKDWKEEVTR